MDFLIDILFLISILSTDAVTPFTATKYNQLKLTFTLNLTWWRISWQMLSCYRCGQTILNWVLLKYLIAGESVIHIKFAVGEDENLLSIQIEAQICPIRVQTRKVMFSKQCKIGQFIFVTKLKLLKHHDLKLYENLLITLASLQDIHVVSYLDKITAQYQL